MHRLRGWTRGSRTRALRLPALVAGTLLASLAAGCSTLPPQFAAGHVPDGAAPTAQKPPTSPNAPLRPSPGQPQPHFPSPEPSGPDGAAGTPNPQPLPLSLRDVDPCRVFTEQHREQLGFDRDPLAEAVGGYGDSATCTFRDASAKLAARMSLVTDEAMRTFPESGSHAQSSVRAQPITVSGFPGLLITKPKLDLSCTVTVAVAPDQHLDVLYRDDGARSPAPLPQLCAGAQRVAATAVNALQQVAAAPTGSSSRAATEQNPADQADSQRTSSQARSQRFDQ